MKKIALKKSPFPPYVLLSFEGKKGAKKFLERKKGGSDFFERKKGKDLFSKKKQTGE